MSRIRQMLRFYYQGENKLKISELTGVLRNTFKKYFKIYEQLGFPLPDIEQLIDQQLDRLFGENLLPEPGEKYKVLESFFPTCRRN